jgi:hypothetical protein
MMINIVIYFIMWITLPVLISGFILLGSVSSSAYPDSASQVNSGQFLSIGISAFFLVICLIVPIVYIYFWIVVNNLRFG